MLAVILPETGQGVEAAAERIARLPSNLAGCTVTSGIARYPADSQTSVDLMRIATERSSAAPIPVSPA